MLPDPVYEALVESAPDAMLVVDADGTIVLVNAQTEAMFGYPRAELDGLPVEVLVPETRRSLHAKHRAGFAEDPRARPMGAGIRLFARRKDGTEFPVEISLSPLRHEGSLLVAAAVRDVSERLKTEEQNLLMHDATRALGEAPDYETGLRTVLEAICSHTGWPFGQAWRPGSDDLVELGPAWFDETDERAGVFRDASARRADEVGHRLIGEVRRSGRAVWVSDLRGERLARAEDAAEAGYVSAVFIPVLAGGEPVAVLEFFMRETTAEDERLLGIVSAIAGRLGALFERKHAVDALARAYEREQEASERLRALDRMKDTFLHAVSHELRSPLAVVVGFADTLAEHRAVLDDEQIDHMVSSIASHASRLNNLLTDLLDLDRLARGVLEPKRSETDVASIARRSAGELELDDRELNIEGDGVTAFVDPSKVERILENLLSNAARYSPAGTPIDVRVSRDDGAVLVEVADRGSGVPDALKIDIFNVFDRGGASPSIPGTGIGLSLVSRFAELHGGRAWVEDRPGGGALFKVLLPDAAARDNP